MKLKENTFFFYIKQLKEMFEHLAWLQMTVTAPVIECLNDEILSDDQG